MEIVQRVELRVLVRVPDTTPAEPMSESELAGANLTAKDDFQKQVGNDAEVLACEILRAGVINV